MKLHWVECLVCTKPVAKPRIQKWRWSKIYDNGAVQFWVCENDLHEQLVQEARIAFGKALEQVVRMGSKPEVLYPIEEEE
jgi:hypothetical protein